MFVKFIVTFLVIFLLRDCNSQPINNKTDNGESEKTVQIPRSLIEEMLKKQRDLEEIKEFIHLVSTSNSTAVTRKPSTAQPEPLVCPISRVISAVKKVIANLKKRMKDAKTMNNRGRFRSKRVAKLVYILQGLQGELGRVATAGRDMKTIWRSIKEFLEEDDDEESNR